MHEMELENAKFTSAARLWVSSISVSLGAVYRTYAVSNYEDLVSSWTRAEYAEWARVYRDRDGTGLFKLNGLRNSGPCQSALVTNLSIWLRSKNEEIYHTNQVPL